MIKTTKTTYNREYNEYRVRLFIDGIHQAGADYFTNDREDAEHTAAHMKANGGYSDKTTSFAKDEAKAYREEIEEQAGEDEEGAIEELLRYDNNSEVIEPAKVRLTQVLCKSELVRMLEYMKLTDSTAVVLEGEVVGGQLNLDSILKGSERIATSKEQARAIRAGKGAKRNWFDSLNEALESEGLVDSWTRNGGIAYGETFGYTFDNGSKYGHYVSIYRDEQGRYERPIHYNR